MIFPVNGICPILVCSAYKVGLEERTFTRTVPLYRYHKNLRDQIAPKPQFVKIVNLRGY